MRKHNTLKWLLTGALMLTAITACGKENNKAFNKRAERILPLF